MAYTTPRTWVATETVTAALLNTHVRDNFTAVNAGALSVASQATGDWLQASSATQFARVQPYSPMLTANTTAVGNVGSGEDDLMSYAVAAGLLGTDGWGLEVLAGFVCANNGNNKTIKLYFGATAVVTLGAGAFTAEDAVIRATIIRTGATAQVAIGDVVNKSTAWAKAFYTAPAETLANAITIKCTGSATSDNDVSQKLMLIRLIH
jgi:alkyl sulfatase BDS1-like metallo-beta-lactamase superfamily hydrolase